MSVLNDINVQDGYGIRILASHLGYDDARETIGILRNIDCHRMDSTELSLDATEDRQNAADLANAHWTDDDGRMCWGTPSGTWRDFCDRVLDGRKFWRDDVYLPVTTVQVDEVLARDLLLATYMFPFVMARNKANTIVKSIMLPVLSEANPRKVHVGSRAVFRLVKSAMDNGEVCGMNSNISKVVDFRQMSEFNLMWSVSAGPNYHDSGPAIKRASKLDWDVANKGRRYIALAEFANYIESCMARGANRGPAMRAAKKFVSRNDDVDILGLPQHMKVNAIDMFRSGKNAAISTHDNVPGMRVAAASNIALVRLDGEYFLLTREDLKSIRFSAMSHSLWHMYAGTLAIEYEPTERIIKPTNVTPEVAQVIAGAEMAAKAIDAMKSLAASLGVSAGQQIVPYESVKKSIADIWDWYADILDAAIESKSHDYLGRYINEVFSIYTGRQGGDLMEEAVSVAIEELVAEYSRYGFHARHDVKRLLRIFEGMPESAIQDFGRIAKIVPAYDVNPMYSFLDRARKMQKPNPRGRATMTGTFTHTTREFDTAERAESDIRLKCSARICAVFTDAKARILGSMDETEKKDMEELGYDTIYARIRAAGRQVSSAATLLNTPIYPVPAAKRQRAKAQAKALIERGDDPTEIYAGAYVCVSNIFSYMERGEPDLAILKATAIVSGQLHVAMSNMSGLPRATPTRLNDGMKERGTGTMITDFLKSRFPSRPDSLAFIGKFMPIASTSDKIETVKYPLKTRVITSMCAEGRRIQGEFEYNNGKVLIHAPGFMIGVSPADRLRRTYAALRQDTAPGKVRLYGSLDLSSYSQGMHWAVQTAVNEVLADAYGMSADVMEKLEACTLGTYMIRSEANLRLFTVNSIGSNYEGLDGKRNTFGHCAMWYIARVAAANKGVEGSMRAFLYIDDGAFAIEVEESNIVDVTRTMREALIETYVEFGYKLNLSKTVLSSSYMQFLNEIFLHGVHIGYGFRALCHTGAQTFPAAATISEELDVISGGIRGSGVAGGQSLRLMIGFNYILWLYLAGVIGSKGRALADLTPFATSLVLYLPKCAGGFGLPSWVQLYSNLAGHRDVEHMAKVALMAKACGALYPEKLHAMKCYVKSYMVRSKTMAGDEPPTRLSVAHAGSSIFGPGDRDMQIANAALEMCTNKMFRPMLQKYVDSRGTPNPSGVAKMLASALAGCPIKLPPAILDTALNTDPNIAVSTLITKVTSGFLIDRMLSRSQIAALNRRYVRNGRAIAEVARSFLA